MDARLWTDSSTYATAAAEPFLDLPGSWTRSCSTRARPSRLKSSSVESLSTLRWLAAQYGCGFAADSSRSTRTSLRRRRTSSFSSVGRPSERRPSSRAACTTQFRMALAEGSNLRASSSGSGRRPPTQPAGGGTPPNTVDVSWALGTSFLPQRIGVHQTVAMKTERAVLPSGSPAASLPAGQFRNKGASPRTALTPLTRTG
jgi:hypothetical protein